MRMSQPAIPNPKPPPAMPDPESPSVLAAKRKTVAEQMMKGRAANTLTQPTLASGGSYTAQKLGG